MIRKLLNRAVAVAVAAAAAFVAIVALGATLFYALTLVLVPLGAAAVTAGLFTVVAIIAFLVFSNKAAGDEDDDYDDEAPEGMPQKLLHLVQQRPVIGIVAALAAGAVILRKPGLAALAMTFFNDSSKDDHRGRDRKRSRRRR